MTRMVMPRALAEESVQIAVRVPSSIKKLYSKFGKGNLSAGVNAILESLAPQVTKFVEDRDKMLSESNSKK